jgi:hypothetical protein
MGDNVIYQYYRGRGKCREKRRRRKKKVGGCGGDSLIT